MKGAKDLRAPGLRSNANRVILGMGCGLKHGERPSGENNGKGGKEKTSKSKKKEIFDLPPGIDLGCPLAGIRRALEVSQKLEKINKERNQGNTLLR